MAEPSENPLEESQAEMFPLEQQLEQTKSILAAYKLKGESKFSGAILERDKAKAQHNIYNAIRRKDLKAIEAMIAKSVDLDKPNTEGKSPRAYAEELGEEKVLGVLG